MVRVLVERVLERVEADDEPSRDGGQDELARHLEAEAKTRVQC